MPRNSAARAVVADRRARVWAERLAGKAMRAIAAEVGTSVATVCRDVSATLAEVNATAHETAAALRVLEAERLDALWAALWPDMLAGDVRAVAVGLRIMERRAALFGLDAPKGCNGTVSAGGRTRVRWGDGSAEPKIPLEALDAILRRADAADKARCLPAPLGKHHG